MHKSLDDLKDAIDPQILPKEYGGVVPLSEMISTCIGVALQALETSLGNVIPFLHFSRIQGKLEGAKKSAKVAR